MSYRDGTPDGADMVEADWYPGVQAESRILCEMLTSNVAPTVEEQAHEAIVREFDPDYLPRLERMINRMRAEMMKAIAIPGAFMQAVVDHNSLAMKVEEAITREKK